MRVGVTLPTFVADGSEALEGARRAEELGIDGVFVFDHLWPMGQPDRPALSAFPVLGAVLGVTSRVVAGPLVARIGLMADEELVEQFLSLEHLAPGRVIAGMGTGDSKSEQENRAFGIEYGSAEQRRTSLRHCAQRLRDSSMSVWIGGGSAATNEIAHQLGVFLNLWDADDETVRTAAAVGPVTWGGPVPGDRAAVTQRLQSLAQSGAEWAVCAWPSSLDDVAAAARTVR